MKNQSGRSLLEMIAVVGIIGLLTVAGFSGLGGGTASMRATSAQYDIEELAKRIIEVNAWNRDGCFNEINGVDTGGLSDNLGGITPIAGIDCAVADGKYDSFSFTYGNLSKKECRILKTKVFSELCPSGDCDNSNTLTFTYNRTGDACP